MVEWLGRYAGTRQVMPDVKPQPGEWVIEVTYDTGEIRRWLTDIPHKVKPFDLYEWKLGNVEQINFFTADSAHGKLVLR